MSLRNCKFLHRSTTITLLITVLFTVHQVACRDARSKIDPEVENELKNGNQPVVIAECDKMASPNVGSTVATILKMDAAITPITPSGKERILDGVMQNLISSTLKALAAPIKLLEMAKASFTVLWIQNWIVIRGADLPLLLKLVSLDTILTIRLDKRTGSPMLRGTPPPPPPSFSEESDWNLKIINARCPDIKCNGTNVTVGIISSGVMVNHTELIGKWVGGPFGWWNGSGPAVSAEPSDDFGAGTFAAGIILGTNVGVAPGAKYMACKACDSTGSYSQAALLECAQWMLCPWRWDDRSAGKNSRDCTKRPNIVHVDSGFFVGGQLLDEAFFWFYDTLKLWNAQKILSTFPMGESGPNCNSGWIPGNYDIALAVGGVVADATVMDGSSRGPTIINRPFTKNSTADGTCPAFNGDARKCTGTSNGDTICTLYKPDIVGPGYLVNASWITNTTSYQVRSGTNIAAAHVAGVMALMNCSNPNVAWDYLKAHDILVKSANREIIDELGNRENDENFAASSHLLCDLILSLICSGFPNNLYGNGLVNACGAVKASKLLKG